MKREAIFDAITEERRAQWRKFNGPHEWGTGDCSSLTLMPEVKVMVLTEETGEVARAVMERDPDQLRTELVQVAAVCVAWLESL